MIAQLRQNIRHPTKINVIPLPATIDYISVNPDFESKKSIDILDIVSNTIDDINIDDTSNTSVNCDDISDANYDFTISMMSHMTLFYMILTEKFKFSDIDSRYYNEIICKKFVMIGSMLMIASLIGVKYMILSVGDINNFLGTHTGWIIIVFCDCFIFVCCSILMLSLNYTLLHFKKRSFVVYWKLYNIVTLYVVLYILYSRFETNQFSHGHFTFTESIIESILSLIYIGEISIILSFQQSYNVSKYWKLFCIFLMIVAMFELMIEHFLNDEMDYQFKLFIFLKGNNQYISLRNITISKSFDLILWFSYQFYQIWKRPNTIYLVWKIEIQWDYS